MNRSFENIHFIVTVISGSDIASGKDLVNCDAPCLSEMQINISTSEDRLNAVSNKLSLFHLYLHVHTDFFQIQGNI